MDFSKIKKIFYIVCIISMLLSIKSKVFGASFDYKFDNTNYTLLLPDFIDEHNLNYFVDFYYGASGVGFDLIISDNTELNVTGSYQNMYTFNNQQFVYYPYSTSLSNFNAQGMNTFLNNASNYFRGLTYSNNYENKQGQYGWGNYYGLIRNDQVEIQSYLSTININENNNIIFPSNSFIAPSFTNSTEIENGNPDGVFISPGDYSSNDYLYFHLLEIQTGISNQDNSRYYYADKIFALNKDSDFFSTWVDPSIDGYYYYIPRYKLGLSQNSSYLYVLNNSKSQIQNSNGLIQIDKANGVYDVVQSDTTGVITATEEETDRMKNIESTITQNQETVNSINDSLTNSNVTNETESDISNNLNFNSSTPQFSNLFNSYFSQLTSLVADLGNYQDSAVLTINLPVPHTNSNIPIRSDIFSSHVPADIYFIIQMFWLFIFGRYYLKFLLRIYRLASTGLLLDYYSLSGEIITQDML